MSSMERQRLFMADYGEQVEQLLSILVYFVPVQDEEGDGLAGVSTQATYSVIDLFSIYRTVLLRRPAAVPVALAAGFHGDKAEALATLRGRYTATAFSLRSLQALAVIVEMRARKVSGARQVLVSCLSVEAVKLVLKLLLRFTMPFAFYVDDAALESAEPSRPSPFNTDAGPGSPSGPGLGSQIGRLSPQAPSLLSLVSKRTGPSALTLVAEVLFHGRPFLHLTAMLQKGEKAWSAWTAALACEGLAYALLHAAVQQRPGPQTRAMALEQAELARRRWLLIWAFARSPFFEAFLERKAVALDKFLRRVPVLNVFNFVEIFLAFRPFYFYTSGT